GFERVVVGVAAAADQDAHARRLGRLRQRLCRRERGREGGRAEQRKDRSSFHDGQYRGVACGKTIISLHGLCNAMYPLVTCMKTGSEGTDMKTKRRAFIGGVSAVALTSPYVARAQKKYDDGASDSEIKIGHTCPYSGPASAYGVNGKAIVAYF